MVSQSGTPDEKRAALRDARALNPRPQAVADALFTAGQGFFDARDLVQVKYEMLRRMHLDGYSVTQAAAAFGVSRPTFYQAQRAWHRAGLAGLVPARPGPRRAHKLDEAVLRFLQQARAADPQSRAAQPTGCAMAAEPPAASGTAQRTDRPTTASQPRTTLRATSGMRPPVSSTAAVRNTRPQPP